MQVPPNKRKTKSLPIRRKIQVISITNEEEWQQFRAAMHEHAQLRKQEWTAFLAGPRTKEALASYNANSHNRWRSINDPRVITQKLYSIQLRILWKVIYAN